MTRRTRRAVNRGRAIIRSAIRENVGGFSRVARRQTRTPGNARGTRVQRFVRADITRVGNAGGRAFQGLGRAGRTGEQIARNIANTRRRAVGRGAASNNRRRGTSYTH